MEAQKEDDNQKIFQGLKQWVEEAGGEIHSSIELRGQENRGLFATKAIKKGELLIRLPSALAVSGEKLPKKFKDRVASPWLRCLSSLYLAQDDKHWKPYILSLPSKYDDHLWQWKDEEIDYLGGTALGETLRADREEGSLQGRITHYVLPYLRFLKIPNASDSLQVFKQLSMCISTRGFHMQPPEDGEAEVAEASDKKPAAKTKYVGPFLLPVIDLLNHSDTNKTTTLQRDQGTGAFCMIAERDVSEGEELTHSYGDLTASQLLQTFGFVPIGRALAAETQNITPAMISKRALVDACESVKKSSYPKDLVATMEQYNIEGDTFELDDAKGRNLLFLSDQFLITPSATGNYLSDEIVTLCCTQLLPNEVYYEIFGAEPKQLLGQEVLEDYYLGKLVLMAILTAYKNTLKKFRPLSGVPGVSVEETDDKAILQQLLSIEKHDNSTLRAMYGITIRLEEKKGLEELRNEVITLISSLDEEGDEEDAGGSRQSKKMKAVE